MGFAVPFVAAGGVERVVHDAVGGRAHRLQAVVSGPVEFHRRAQRAARHFQRTHQSRQQGARPAAFEPAPAIIDALAQHYRHRAERQGLAFDLDGLADTGMGEIFVGDAADGGRRHVAFGLGPFRGEFRDVIDQHLEGRPGLGRRMSPALAVRPVLDARDGKTSHQRRRRDRGVERFVGVVGEIADQRFQALGIAQVIAVGADQVGAGGDLAQIGHVADLAPVALAHDAVDQREQEGRIGLGFDRHPFGRHGAGDRQMRLDLDALQPARACVRLTLDTRDAARRLDIVAAIDDIGAGERVGGDDEGAVPQLAVKMFRMVALDPLAAAEAEIGRPPRRQERREGAHILGRRAAAAEARREARKPFFVAQAAGADIAHFLGHRVERFVPGDRRETGVLAPALFGVGALHGLAHPVRVIGLLDQPIGLHADPTGAGVFVDQRIVGIDPRRDAVLDLDIQQIGPGDALVAVNGNGLALRNFPPRGHGDAPWNTVPANLGRNSPQG